MTPRFLSDAKLEDMAASLLSRYESRHGAVVGPPVPIEHILEDVLDLSVLWEPIPERTGQSVLAALDPDSRMVIFNETRRHLIEETPGLYNTILAHEAGHWELHVDHGLLAQRPLPNFEREFTYLYRSSGPGQDPREVQAHKYMGFVLMPSHVLAESIRNVDLLSWPVLYELRDRFQVTITALKIRLERLGLLYVTENGRLHSSRQEYEGQIRFEV